MEHPVSIVLGPDALRDEIKDRGTFSDEQIAALTALPDEELEDAVRETVTDSFWYEFDNARSDAIAWLMRRHALGEESVV
jgi:hypothetical protein